MLVPLLPPPPHSTAQPPLEPLPLALVSQSVWGCGGGGVNLGVGKAELGEKGDSADLVFEPQVRQLQAQGHTASLGQS